MQTQLMPFQGNSSQKCSGWGRKSRRLGMKDQREREREREREEGTTKCSESRCRSRQNLVWVEIIHFGRSHNEHFVESASVFLAPSPGLYNKLGTFAKSLQRPHVSQSYTKIGLEPCLLFSRLPVNCCILI